MEKVGVYKATKKDGTLYYRASFTYKGKHISLGSYSSNEEAHQAYLDAKSIVENEGSIDESEQAILEDGEISLDDEAVVNYPILEPITREELSDAYKDDNVNGNVFGLIFSDEELLEMYKSGKVSIKIFTLILDLTA